MDAPILWKERKQQKKGKNLVFFREILFYWAGIQTAMDISVARRVL